MSVATLPARSAAPLAGGQPRSVLVCVPPGPSARLFIERIVARGGGDHLVRIATTPHQALTGYARQNADVVLVDRNFARDPIGMLGTRRAPRTAVIVIDVGTDGDLLALMAQAATGGMRGIRRQPGVQIRLTGREEQVLRRLCDGATNDEIADELGIGADTVKTHVRRVYEKLGARRRTQAVALAMRAGLVD
jgi:DNA-binding NarL/FixJ family response regulator